MIRTESALGRHIERWGFLLAGLIVTAILVVMFYYPVTIVLADAVLIDGRLDPGQLWAIITDEFYFGIVAGLLTRPIETLTTPTETPLGLFGFTTLQAVLSTIASILLGLPGAYVLARFEFPGRKTIRSLTALPFVMPSIMVAIGFVAMFGSNGTLNTVLTALGLPKLELMFTLEIIVLAHAFYDAPLIARITAAAWENVDARMIETARSLGAGPNRAFRDVIVPQLLPAVLTGALLTFIFSFLSFAIVLALGGLELATVEVWVFHSVNQLEYGTAATLAVLETVLSLVLTYGYLRYEARQRATRTARPQDRSPLFGELTTARVGVYAYSVLAVIIFVGPIASMLVASVTGPEGLTLRNYEFLLRRQIEAYSFQVKPLTAIQNSLLFGVTSLAIAVPMGVLLAILSTRNFRGRKLIDALAMAPFAVSGIVVGLGLLRGLVFGIEIGDRRIQVAGALAIVAAHAVGAYPFVTRNVAPMLSSLDRTLVESARALGATRMRVLLDIELPLVFSGIIAGAAFAFAISMGEFDSTVILATGGQSYTIPVAMERFLGRRLGPATAMGCILLVVTAVSFVVIDRVGEGFHRG
ncbi:MAG: ABC transporter permease [Halobacteriales archaeon]